MKNSILFIIASLFAISNLCAQNNYLYKPDGNKVYFMERNDIKYVKFVSGTSLLEKSASISALSLLSVTQEEIADDIYRFTVSNINEAQFESTAWGMSQVEYCSSLISSLTDTSYKSWAKNKLFVDMKQNYVIEDMLESSEIAYTDLLQWDSQNPRYIVTLQRGADPIGIANFLYETGLVHYAIPVFCIDNVFQYNPTPQQWGLYNYGQDLGTQGIDINVIPAWDISSGQGITVAIADNGVELDHPDLQQNIVWGYGSTSDCQGGSCGDNPHSHGTQCAGIVAAVDNAIGIKGVAYEAKIMPLKIGSGRGINTDEAVLGIRYAYEHGADVLSCSFGTRVADNELPTEDMFPLLQALTNARTLGRNGKGCVVVCASGNDNDPYVAIPANQEGNLAVGAIDRCGIRSGGEFAVGANGEQDERCGSWGAQSTHGSCYGYALDVVAPGTDCSTTTLNDTYTNTFNGTSAACPHVSGVAALMLSANPGLSESEVRNIICSTAVKNREDVYTYSDNPYHPHGSWNTYVGYGLVNANAAVLAATSYDLYIRDNETDDGTEPGSSSFSSMTFNSPDIWLRRTNDGGTLNQGINYGAYNYVYVRIHNRGEVSSSPNDILKLYMGHAGSHMDCWPSGWVNVGAQSIPSIPAGSSDIVCIPVYFPSTYQYGMQHFPLVALIVSNYDELNNLSGSSAALLAYNNNNIAIENVSTAMVISLEDEPTTLAADTYISNDSTVALAYDIKVKFAPNQSGIRLTNIADICLIVSDGLMQCLALSNALTIQGAGAVNDSTYKVTDTVVSFNNVLLPSRSVYRFRVQANYLTEAEIGNEESHVNIQQLIPIKGLVGGADIEFFSEGRDLFYANAGEDVLSEMNSLVILQAEGIGEPATYRWFNQNGSLVHSGQVFQIIATASSSYQLEVTADADGYRDYDTVNVNLILPHITSIVPNPVSQNTVTVHFSRPDSSIVQLLVANAYSPSETIGVFPVSAGAVSSNIDITSFPQGVYSVSLMVDGVVTDTKNFIRVQ